MSTGAFCTSGSTPLRGLRRHESATSGRTCRPGRAPGGDEPLVRSADVSGVDSSVIRSRRPRRRALPSSRNVRPRRMSVEVYEIPRDHAAPRRPDLRSRDPLRGRLLTERATMSPCPRSSAARCTSTASRPARSSSRRCPRSWPSRGSTPSRSPRSPPPPGVGRTAVYNHFPDKESLLLGFITHETEQYAATLQRSLDDIDDPDRAAADATSASRPQLTRVYHLAPGPELRSVLSRGTQQRVREHVVVVEQILRRILAAGIESGAFPEQDLDVTVPLINACLSGRGVPADGPERERAIAADRGSSCCAPSGAPRRPSRPDRGAQEPQEPQRSTARPPRQPPRRRAGPASGPPRRRAVGRRAHLPARPRRRARRRGRRVLLTSAAARAGARARRRPRGRAARTARRRRRLRTAVAAFVVLRFDVPRPKSLTSGDHLQRIVDAMYAVAARRRLVVVPVRGRGHATRPCSRGWRRCSPRRPDCSTTRRTASSCCGCAAVCGPARPATPAGTCWCASARGRCPRGPGGWPTTRAPPTRRSPPRWSGSAASCPPDRVLNLMCGSGTLLVERLLAGPAAARRSAWTSPTTPSPPRRRTSRAAGRRPRRLPAGADADPPAAAAAPFDLRARRPAVGHAARLARDQRRAARRAAARGHEVARARRPARRPHARDQDHGALPARRRRPVARRATRSACSPRATTRASTCWTAPIRPAVGAQALRPCAAGRGPDRRRLQDGRTHY